MKHSIPMDEREETSAVDEPYATVIPEGRYAWCVPVVRCDRTSGRSNQALMARLTESLLRSLRGRRPTGGSGCRGAMGAPVQRC